MGCQDIQISYQCDRYYRWLIFCRTELIKFLDSIARSKLKN